MELGQRAAILALVVALAAGCRSEPDTPEARIRALIGKGEAAAEARDVGAVKALVADGYRDDQGLDKRALTMLLAREFLGHQSIHLFTQIGSIDLTERGRARVVVYAAMAGRPIPSLDELAALRADIYRFDCELLDEDGDWKLARAAWRPAEIDDLR